MYFNLETCFCFVLFLLVCVRSQRSSWGSPKRGYNNDNGFWNSNAGGNSFSSNQNSGVGSWGSNAANNKKPGFGNVDSDTYSSNPISGNNNKKVGMWGASPTEASPVINFGNGKNSNRESGNERAPSWNSKKPSQSNSGNSGNWQSEAFNGKKENEKKLASITNWNSDSNKIPSTDDNDNSVSSSWGSGGKSPTSDLNGGQNSRPSGNNWNSNNENNNNNWNSKPSSGSSSSQNSRPVNSGNWGSESNGNNNWNAGGNNKKTGNDNLGNSDYEDNSSGNSNNKQKTRPTQSSSSSNGRNPQTNQNSGSSYNSQKGKDRKPSTPGNTNASNNGGKKPSNSGNGQNPSNSNTQDGKSSSVDTSILDELDKNDWYFGRESDYPKPPFKSTLNIDVSELWNFDRNRRPNKNVGSSSSSSTTNNSNNNNKRRKNRQIGGFKGVQEINCECVSVNLCDEEDMIITQEDVKYDWRPLKAFRCEDLTEVCCTNPKNRISNRININEELQEIQGGLRCGQRRIQNVFAGLGGNIAEPGEFPWSLSLEYVENNCSASLIHPGLALTAAHCVASAQPEELTVKAGVWKSNDEPSQSRRVVKIIPHPDYNSRNPRNDIALLVLENPFKLTDNVNTVCLPVTNDKWDPNECLVAGWNLEDINEEELDVLEKGVVNFLPQDECQNIMLVTDLWRNYILHDSFVCGIEKNKRESCLGDEGSPLICPSKKQPGTYLQIGIVSKGMNCDEFGRPGIFTNVLKFLDWINKNTFELGLYDDIDVRSL